MSPFAKYFGFFYCIKQYFRINLPFSLYSYHKETALLGRVTMTSSVSVYCCGDNET